LAIRWLLSRGYSDELAKILQKASAWNRITLPENFQKMLSSPSESSKRRVSIFDLFQKGYRRTTTLMAIVWFSIILLYFGITLHMGSLGGNIYLNVVCIFKVNSKQNCLIFHVNFRSLRDQLRHSVSLRVFLSYLS
jgi:hypothetical protein